MWRDALRRTDARVPLRHKMDTAWDMAALKSMRAHIANLEKNMDSAREIEEEAMAVLGYRKAWTAGFCPNSSRPISRALSMNAWTAGVSVRFRNVTIATGEGRADSRMGSSLSPNVLPLSRSIERGSTAM